MRSHSNAAQGGINAALQPDDSWESHAFDTVKGSDYLGDQDAIEIMCREAPDEILHLEHLGVTFHRNDEGKLGTRAFGVPPLPAPTTSPTCLAQAIMHVLYEQLMKYEELIDRYEEWFTTGLSSTPTATASGRSSATSPTARWSCSRPSRRSSRPAATVRCSGRRPTR